MKDLRPYVCTFRDCSQAGQTYASRSAFLYHEFSAHGEIEPRSQISRRMSQLSFRPLDVLVCEDHPVSKLVMERLLKKLECRTITVTNGEEAARYAMSEVQFDIIMMEFKLPHINGADVARMIRDTKSANTQTPIMAVTGYLKELPQTHHFDSLIEKPPTLEKLTEALCNLCAWKPPLAKYNPQRQQRQKERQPRFPKTCVFCEEVLSSYNWKDRTRHLARHMEEIAFTVVTKPYEDWDFYSDASSVKNQGTDNPRNTTASYDAKGDEDTTYQNPTQRVSCALCTEQKTFSGAHALRRHMRVVHPHPGGANQA